MIISIKAKAPWVVDGKDTPTMVDIGRPPTNVACSRSLHGDDSDSLGLLDIATGFRTSRRRAPCIPLLPACREVLTL